MSWSLDIRTRDLDNNDVWVEVVDGHTYNLTPMWRKALSCIDDTRDFDGKRCEDLILDLQIGICDFELHPEEYEKLNPSNGWGDFKGFAMIFHRFYELCRKYPSGELVWRG